MIKVKYPDPDYDVGTQQYLFYLKAAVGIRDLHIVALKGIRHELSNESQTQTKMESKEFAVEQMIFCRAIDNFQTYLTDILTAVFEKYPHAFYRSKVDAELVFEMPSIHDIRKTLIDREVRSLSYKSILDLQSFVLKATGFSLFQSSLQARRVQHLVYRRNLITHNRGFISDLFKELSGMQHLQLGTSIVLSNGGRVARYLDHVAVGIDERCVSKFKLDAREGW